MPGDLVKLGPGLYRGTVVHTLWHAIADVVGFQITAPWSYAYVGDVCMIVAVRGIAAYVLSSSGKMGWTRTEFLEKLLPHAGRRGVRVAG